SGGNDLISATSGDITAEGGGGRDRIRTGNGKDRVSGGAGRGSIVTGRGNDRIEAMDGQRDRVNCGRGKHDQVTADFDDVVTGCEQQTRGGPRSGRNRALWRAPAP